MRRRPGRNHVRRSISRQSTRAAIPAARSDRGARAPRILGAILAACGHAPLRSFATTTRVHRFLFCLSLSLFFLHLLFVAMVFFRMTLPGDSTYVKRKLLIAVDVVVSRDDIAASRWFPVKLEITGRQEGGDLFFRLKNSSERFPRSVSS